MKLNLRVGRERSVRVAQLPTQCGSDTCNISEEAGVVGCSPPPYGAAIGRSQPGLCFPHFGASRTSRHMQHVMSSSESMCPELMWARIFKKHWHFLHLLFPLHWREAEDQSSRGQCNKMQKPGIPSHHVTWKKGLADQPPRYQAVRSARKKLPLCQAIEM